MHWVDSGGVLEHGNFDAFRADQFESDTCKRGLERETGPLYSDSSEREPPFRGNLYATAVWDLAQGARVVRF